MRTVVVDCAGPEPEEVAMIESVSDYAARFIATLAKGGDTSIISTPPPKNRNSHVLTKIPSKVSVYCFWGVTNTIFQIR